MYRYTKTALIAVVLGSLGTASFAAREMHNDALALKQANIGLIQAVTAAEEDVHGKAARAEFEKTSAGWAWDVEVVQGTKVFDVRVDASNGTVVSSVPDKIDRHDRHDQID